MSYEQRSIPPPGFGPQLSADGRWWWDGTRWVPTQTGAAAYVAYAGFWRRLLAWLIDLVVVYIPLFVLQVMISILAAAATQIAGRTVHVGLLSYPISIAAFWLYFSLMESSHLQATLGKMALGIRVTDHQGARITWGRASGRFFAKYLSALICYIGFVMAAFTARKQALHDMVAGTLAVRSGVVAPRPAPSGAGVGTALAVIGSVVGVLVLTSVVVVVILLTMGGQISNVFSNVTVALNSP